MTVTTDMAGETHAAAAYAAYRERRYFGSLDGLRCFCICLVLWHHRMPLYPEADLPMILLRGFTGVDFFFVLSGFLITTLLLREEDRDGRFSIAGFYKRRFLRIIPIYFLVVTLCGLLWIGVKGQDQWWTYLPYYYLFLANFLEGDIPLLAPTWSLSVEEQFYLVWPALLLLLPALRWRLPLLLILIPLIYIVAQGLLPKMLVAETEIANIALPDPAFGAILLGALLALVLHHPKGFAMAWALLGHRLTPMVLVLSLLVAWQALPAILLGWPSFIMHGLMALILASIAMREDHVLAPLLRWPPIARIGVISYGLYLWHLFGLHIGNEVASVMDMTGPAAALVANTVFLIASVIIAEISFRYYESYFLRLRYC